MRHVAMPTHSLETLLIAADECPPHSLVRGGRNLFLVDIVHHGIIGLGGALVAQHFGLPEAAGGFLIGSVLPDIDVAFMAFGKSRFLRLHQSVTHSIFVIPLLSSAIAALLTYTLSADFTLVFLGCLLGTLGHVALDAANSFGVQALWPLPGRFALDLCFFIDLPLFAASSLALAGVLTGLSVVPLIVGWLIFLAGYFTFKRFWLRKVQTETMADVAIPSGVWPLTYFLTRETKYGFDIGSCRGFARVATWQPLEVGVPSGVLQTLRTSPVYRDLEQALRLFRPVTIERLENGWRVTSRCVAVRNFGNRYGEHVAIIKNGRIIHETARL